MPQHDFDFIAINPQTLARLFRSAIDAGQADEPLRRMLPRQEDRDAFCANARTKGDIWLQNFMSPRITAQDLINTIDNEKLLSRDIYEPFVAKLDHINGPWLPIGTDPTSTILYRLLVGPYGLEPQNEYPWHIDREILPYCFLGINYCFLGIDEDIQLGQPAEPLSRRKANLSEESIGSAVSDDNTPGFVFLQLGTLEYLRVTPDGDTPMHRLNKADWEDTGFALVVRLNAGGYADGIYVVADMLPHDEEETDWGIPPHPKGAQFSCARVATRLGDLGFHTVLELTEIIDHPFKLVWLMLTADGRAVPSCYCWP
jgi:hypothetical protein